MLDFCLPRGSGISRVQHAGFSCAVLNLKKKKKKEGKKSLDFNPWVYFKAYKGKSGLWQEICLISSALGMDGAADGEGGEDLGTPWLCLLSNLTLLHLGSVQSPARPGAAEFPFSTAPKAIFLPLIPASLPIPVPGWEIPCAE